MINPIIVLNHRDPTQWEPYWVWVGANRVWAAKQLGWTSVPAIVTGSCDFFCQLVEPQDLPSYFRDGCPVVDKNGWLGMTGYSNFTKGQLPA